MRSEKKRAFYFGVGLAGSRFAGAPDQARVAHKGHAPVVAVMPGDPGSLLYQKPATIKSQIVIVEQISSRTPRKL